MKLGLSPKMSMSRKRENTINFSPGPAALPDEVRRRETISVASECLPLPLCPCPRLQVVREAQENVMNYRGLGLGVMGKPAEPVTREGERNFV